jgi:hypothetical protein
MSNELNSPLFIEAYPIFYPERKRGEAFAATIDMCSPRAFNVEIIESIEPFGTNRLAAIKIKGIDDLWLINAAYNAVFKGLGGIRGSWVNLSPGARDLPVRI